MSYQITKEQSYALDVANKFLEQWDLLPHVKRNHYELANEGKPTLLTEN